MTSPAAPLFPTLISAVAAGSIRPARPFRPLALFSFYDLTQDTELFLVFFISFLALIGLGKLFNSRTGVRLGGIYTLFCLAISPYLAFVLVAPDLPGRRELGAAALLLGAAALIRPIDELFWRRYFEVKRKAPVPKFLREVSAGLLMTAAAVIVITFDYGLSVPGLLAGSSLESSPTMWCGER